MKELKRRKKKKKGKCQVTNGERERERVNNVRQNVSTTMWGTWWCDESTKLLTFQFFYCCGTNKPEMCWDEN